MKYPYRSTTPEGGIKHQTVRFISTLVYRLVLSASFWHSAGTAYHRKALLNPLPVDCYAHFTPQSPLSNSRHFSCTLRLASNAAFHAGLSKAVRGGESHGDKLIRWLRCLRIWARYCISLQSLLYSLRVLSTRFFDRTYVYIILFLSKPHYTQVNHQTLSCFAIF